MTSLVDRLKSRLGLLALLATALAGLVLLLNILVSLVAAGPADLLAPNPSEERTIDIPNGVGLVTLAVVIVSVILGIVALAAPSHWTLRNGIPRPRRSLAIGAVIALVVLGAGLYLAFSGMLGQDIPYEEHHVERDLVKPVALVALAAFILSVAVVGIINPRLLLATLAVWLLAAIVLGLFSSSGLAGLKLFMRPSEIETSPAYAAEVEKRRTTEDPAPAREVSIPDIITESKPPGITETRPAGRPEEADAGARDAPVDDSTAENNAALISAIAQLLAGTDPEVRAAAARTLGRLADESAIHALVDAVVRDTSPEVQAAALEALAGLDIGQLVRMLREHEEPWMRAAVAAVLGELQDQQAVAQVTESLGGDPAPEVRAAAAEALGKLLDEAAAELLSEALLSDEYAGVRKAAADALGNLGSPEGLDALAQARDGDESFDVRAASGAALEQYPLPALADALREETGPGVRAAAAQLLGESDAAESIPPLVGALEDPDPAVGDAAKAALEKLGSVDWLENGGGVLTREPGPGDVGSSAAFIPGSTESQSRPVPRLPVFQVTGASRSRYLRTTVGQGKLGVTGPGLELPHNRTDLPVRYAGPPGERTVPPAGSHAERITVAPAGRLSHIPAGVVPVSYGLETISIPGSFHPHKGVFVSHAPVAEYSWSATVPEYSRAQLDGAAAFNDPAYILQVRSGRIRELALEITAGQTTPYSRAKAIESYLRTNYVYRFADPSGKDLPPPGHDPVEWFLFDLKEGTCGNFSSAFVALALSIGLPARTVSGWAITPAADTQMVYTDQAHQWAEIAFDGMGWVGFEPTASGGAPTRAAPAVQTSGPIAAESGTAPAPDGTPQSRTPGQGPGDSAGQATQPSKPDAPVNASPTAAAILPTVTEITGWPERMLRNVGFPVDGAVFTASGRPVSEMEVEVFINETKEHGGVRIGAGLARNGVFRAEVEIPGAMGRGGYQLIAHAIGNDRYGESWSDPDITVYSESGLELTGPAEIAVDAQAVFRGRLSEDTGGGMAGQQLAIAVDGQQMPPQTTGPSGDFNFAAVFSEPGSHRVEVSFDDREGNGDFLVGSSARLDLTAVMPTELTVDVPVHVEVGKDFQVSGLLRDVRGIPMPAETVEVRVGNGPPESIDTGPGGEFRLTGPADSAGELTVRAEFAGQPPVLASSGSARLVARHLTRLSLEVSREIMQGENAEFSGRIFSDTKQAVGPVGLTFADSDGNSLGSVTTGDDGAFSHSIPSVDATGAHRVTVSFPGTDSLAPTSAGASFLVLAPTVLTVEGPFLVRAGDPVTATGRLLRAGGQPVSHAGIKVDGADGPPVITGEDGGFAWEFTPDLNGRLDALDVETDLSFAFEFEGTDHLAPASSNLGVTVGVPRVVVEPLQPVARGDAATLRGIVLIGTRAVPDAEISIGPGLHGPGVRLRSNDAGSFTHRYQVPPDAALGAGAIPVDAPGTGASATVPVEVRSASSLIVAPLDRVHPGKLVSLQAILLDDTGTGIPQVVLRTSQGREAVTGPGGVALLELDVPESGDFFAVPVTFRFEGDDRHMPLVYFLGIPITYPRFNWLLWAGVPALLLVVAAAVFASRRLALADLPGPFRRGAAPSTAEDPGASPAAGHAEEGPEPQETRLEISFGRPAPDLPDVWGAGEPVPVRIRLSTLDNRPVAWAMIETHVPGILPPGTLETEGQGICAFVWNGSGLGEFLVSASFAGTPERLASSESRSFRVVEFRAEIVRLYNAFLEWARENVTGISDQATPREVESVLVASGLSIDQKDLDELISRFEEADYSEHLITRQQYEAMYRAWRAATGD